MRCPSCSHDSAEGRKLCRECGSALGACCPLCSFANRESELLCAVCDAPLLDDGLPHAVNGSGPQLPSLVGAGRYTLLNLLSENGRKSVWLARDNRLERDVAVTLVTIAHLGRAGRSRVSSLARVMARLSGHPYIVAPYDAGEEQGFPYIVTEYVPSGSLRDLLGKADNHRLELAETLQIAEQICGALEYAHSLGIAHGNLKPSNVLIALGDSVKLTDLGFGLDFATGASRLTGASVPFDAVAYISPQQVLGNVCDFRSDLYALGAILYEVIAGRPPFVGNNVAEVLTQHLNLQPVLPSWRVADVPASLDALVRSLLQKVPERRPQSAAAVRAQLRAIDAERRQPLQIDADLTAERQPMWVTEETEQVPADPAPEPFAAAQPAASVAGLQMAAGPSQFAFAAAAAILFLLAASALVAKVSLRGSYRLMFPDASFTVPSSHALSQKHDQVRASTGDRTNIALGEASGKSSRPSAADSSAHDGKLEPDRELLALASGGNPGAENTLATMYLRGEGVSKDLAEAARWFREAAARGNSSAQAGLGYMYSSGSGVPQDFGQAARWFREAAAQGDADAQYDLALMYEEGHGVGRDRAEALRWLRKAAAQGSPRAQYELGEAYLEGRGVSQDFARALQWLRKAAGKDEPRAENALGYLYEQGKGVERDYAQALKWYHKAADDGDAKAQLNLGIMYEKGENVVQDYTSAFQWFGKAAEQGDAYAQTSLGVMYCKGEGVSRDYAKALEWFRKAIEQNEPKAEYNLGVMYDNAMGVAKDEVEAVRWYRKAAEQENSDAQYNLAYMYEHGQGMTRDSAEALKWYRKAAEHGDLDARDRLEALSRAR